jgi:hypothetical protein
VTKRGVTKHDRSPADPAAAHIEVVFYPYRDDTACAVTVVRGLGSRAERLRVWSGHLPCNRGDLRGADPRTVTKLLSGELWDALAEPKRHPVAQGCDTGGRAAPAPLEGPQGGSVIQDELPLNLEYLHTPGGIDKADIVKNVSRNL